MATVGNGNGDGDGKRPGWRRIMVPALVGTAVVLIASAIGYSATTQPAPPPSDPAVSGASPEEAAERSCEPLPSRANVHQMSDTITFPEISYSVDEAGDRPRIDLAGTYRGDIDEGRRIAVIARADPGSRDAGPEHRPGDGHYYYVQELQVDEEAHCWSALSLNPADSGSRGLDWHLYLVLVPVDFGVTSVSARNQVEDGVFEELESLAVFRVNI
ncbi:hypothetical protein [Sphaerisporangium corydalis]|uniref:Uncharacterized protein n=1 Tax=Sphaerisporangium corydalis TaxID=1441875 RepID=A0ABV9ESW8_9ACTN|nr:hypothetical protein [Sphaerisporangium corydalis]